MRADDCEEYKKVILHSIEMAKEGNQVHTSIFGKIYKKKKQKKQHSKKFFDWLM